MKSDDEAFEQRVKTALDSSLTGLDAGTRCRLAAMRAQAFDGEPLLSRRPSFRHWVPATAFAACAVLAAVLIVSFPRQEPPDQLALQDTDVMLELLLGEEQEELGDPDFYVWLDAVLLEEEARGDAS